MDATILLVEDEARVRTELAHFLQRFSRTVITAENGEEGLEHYRSYAPDIVVSDIRMPKMNGIDMAKAIKKLSPEQSIVFTTAHGDNGYFLEAIEMQIDGYILKPVDLALLEKKIQAITKKLKAEKESKLYGGILDDIAQMQDSMLAVYDEEASPIFFNKKLLTFLGYPSLAMFLKEHGSLSALFERKEGCFYPGERADAPRWIEKILEEDPEKRIVSMQGTRSEESQFFVTSVSPETQNKNRIVTFSEITSIVEEKRRYKHDAHTDALTQISNRARFNLQFDEAMTRCKIDRSDVSIILLDIDNFKEINDRHGHSVGDRVLKQFAGLVSTHIRITDSLFRWGGEEFILLLPETSVENAEKIAENLRVIIEEHDFGIGEKMTCSFGVAGMKGGYQDTRLFERADQALYRAKDKGRNQVVVASR